MAKGVQPAQNVVALSSQPINDDKSLLSTHGQTATFEESFEKTGKKMICVFGPLKSFFYYAGDRSISWTKLMNSFDTSSISEWNINTPYCVALSPFGAEYFAYSSYSTGVSWRFLEVPITLWPKKSFRKRNLYKKFEILRENHQRLKRWLDENVVTEEDVKTCKVAFGPGLRYMAWKPQGAKWIGYNLPVAFTEEMNSRQLQAGGEEGGKSFPLELVTFGVGNAWAAIWSDGSDSIDLDGHYTKLSDCLRHRGGEALLYISLSHSEGDTWFLRFKSPKQYCSASPRKRQIIVDDWKAQTLDYSKKHAVDVTMTTSLSSGGGQEEESSRHIITPEMADQAAMHKLLVEAQESERNAEKAALLSIESSKTSIDASHIAIVAGGVALLSACTVM
ncbi:hypothetical protein N0V82_008856 [Gnomoniopsis sp. IMI 355080]|nr:hypothetical protein N0V82_008856 [Gnomoniopsis sp. IMI 355080]